MRISDCLLMLLENSDLEACEISAYIRKLIELEYVEIQGLKYSLTDKGRNRIKLMRGGG